MADEQGAEKPGIRNFVVGDIVTFLGKTGTLLGFTEGWAVVTVDGEDWRVNAADLRDGTPGL